MYINAHVSYLAAARELIHGAQLARTSSSMARNC
jgi:hypothetical protein